MEPSGLTDAFYAWLSSTAATSPRATKHLKCDSCDWTMEFLILFHLFKIKKSHGAGGDHPGQSSSKDLLGWEGRTRPKPITYSSSVSPSSLPLPTYPMVSGQWSELLSAAWPPRLPLKGQRVGSWVPAGEWTW